MKLGIVLAFIPFLILPANAAQLPTQNDAIALSQAAIGNVLPSLSLSDAKGGAVSLADYKGRPLLISLVYTGCTDVCPAIIDNLYPAVETAQEALGKDSFSVVTIGFDTRHDTPERMVSFARSRGIDLPNWRFLAGSAETVKQLTDTIGFTIVPSAGGFDHMAQVSIIDGKGRIYQQVYGGVFDAPAIVEPLKDLVFGRGRSVLSIGGIVDRVKFFCTVYNPNTGRYYFNYSLFIGIAIALACLGTILGWLIREFRGSDGPGQGVA